MPAREVREIDPVPEKQSGKKPVGLPSMVRCLQLAQKFSAYGFALFAGMHAVSVILAPIISPELGNKTLMFTRTVYQSSLGEPLLVYGTVAVHLLSGFALKVRRAWSTKTKSFFASMIPSNAIQKSGGVLTFLLVGHWLATRLGPLVYLGDSSAIDLGYIKHVGDFGANASMVLLVGAYTYHSVAGFNMWLRLRLSMRKRLSIVAIASLLAILALVRINSLPAATGWQAQQYELAHQLIDKITP